MSTYVNPVVTHHEHVTDPDPIPVSAAAATRVTGDGDFHSWDLPNRWSFFQTSEVDDWTPGGTVAPTVIHSSNVYEWGMQVRQDATTTGHVSATLSGLTPGIEYVVEMISSYDGLGTISVVADGVTGDDLSVTFTASAAEVEVRIEVDNTGGSFADLIVDSIGCRPTSGGYYGGWVTVDADPLVTGPRGKRLEAGASDLGFTVPNGFDTGTIDLTPAQVASRPEWRPVEDGAATPDDVTLDPAQSFVGGLDLRNGWLAFGAAGFLPKQVDPGFGVDALAIGAGAYKDIAAANLLSDSISYTADAAEVSLEFLDAAGAVLGTLAVDNTIVDLPAGTKTVRMKVTATAVGFVPFSEITLTAWTNAVDGGTGVAGSDFLKMEVLLGSTGAWFDILGPTHDIKIVREELNVGTLTATVLDSGLDPARGSEVTIGTPIRVTAKDAADGVFKPLYTGEITHVATKYGHKSTRITVTGSDNIRRLAAVKTPEGHSGFLSLAHNTAQYVTTYHNGTLVTALTDGGEFTNDNASMVDQIAVTRDGLFGHAWIDAANELQLWDISTQDAETVDLSGATWTSDGSVTAEGDGWRITGTTALSSKFAAVPSEPYYLHTFIKREQWATDATLPVFVDVIFYDATDVEIQRDTLTVTPYNPGWEARMPGEISGTQPAGAATFAIEVYYSTGTGDIDIDELRFVAHQPPALFDEDAYGTIDIGFDTDAAINVVRLKTLVRDITTGETSEVDAGEFTLDDSIAAWDRHPVEVKVADNAVTAAGGAQAFVDRIFAANGYPTIRARGCTVPIREAADISKAKGLVDLYETVDVSFEETNTLQRAKVTGIEHRITPGKWIMSLSFVEEGGVAPIQATPSPPPPTEPAPTGATQLTPTMADVNSHSFWIKEILPGVVAVSGYIDYDGVDTSRLDTGMRIPAGLEPVEQVFVNVPNYGSNGHFRYIFNTDGVIEFQQDATSVQGAFEPVSAIWFTT